MNNLNIGQLLFKIVKSDTRQEIYITRPYGKGHPSHDKWKEWSSFIEQNQNQFQCCHNLDEICDVLSDMVVVNGFTWIKGNNIVRTASQIAYKFDIPLDDSCFESPMIQLMTENKLAPSMEVMASMPLYLLMNSCKRIRLILENVKVIYSVIINSHDYGN